MRASCPRELSGLRSTSTLRGKRSYAVGLTRYVLLLTATWYNNELMSKNQGAVLGVRFKNFILSVGVAIGVCFLSMPAQAEQLRLEVYPSSDAPDSRCPEQVPITEESKAHSGGFSVNGRADLTSFAGPFSVVSKDTFSVTWAAKLKPQYSRCKATAGLNDDNRCLSYLRMRFIDGKVLVILDMTGLRDANRFTPTILSQGVKNGNPVWQWGGTD